MADIRYINIQHGGSKNTLAVGASIETAELEGVIRSVFNVSGNVVGFQDQKTGLVFPLSVACKSAKSLPASTFTLLVSGGKSSLDSLPEAPTRLSSANRASGPSSRPVNPPLPPAPPARESAPSSADKNNAEDADDAMDELLRFIAALRIKQMLSKAEADALEELLFENSTLIYAAYSVAKSAGDPKYLATVCRDIAQSLMTEPGRAGCAAQDEVLQYCDRLYVVNKITENQLLYLRHMVLIRDAVVATLYDEFQRHRNPDRFAMELFRLANTHPRWTGEDGEDEDDESGEDDESEKVMSSAVHPDVRSNENRSAVLTGIVNLMSRAGSLTNNEAAVLRSLVTSDNDYVSAAYELFQQDGDVEELEDTLLRISRLELARSGNESASTKAAISKEAAKNERKERLRAERNPFGRYVNSDESDSVEDDDKGSDDEDEGGYYEEQEEKEDAGGAQRYIENFLGGLGVRNTWDSSVPERFIVAVFATAQKGLMSIGQAKALCDLYQAGYDLVIAAWEVFTVQGDIADLMDTLLRIVRGLKFNNNGELLESGGLKNENTMSSSEGSESSSEHTPDPSDEDEKDDDAEDEEEAQASSAIPTESDRSRREIAIRAVAQAKLDLLRHSLEMMVKQGIAPADKAAGLYKRALEGDMLVDAAIEAYANDRNVSEFLDTLNILLQHSPEELDSIMRSAIARQESASTGRRVDDTQRMPVGSAPAPSSSAAGRVAPRFPESQSVPDSADEADLNNAQQQLREIVLELADRDILSPEGKAILIKLIISGDDRLMAAHDVFSESRDLGDLVDSLIRIARLEQAHPSEDATATGGKKREDAGIEMSSLRQQKKAAELDRGFEMTDLRSPSTLSEDDLKHHAGQPVGVHPLSRGNSGEFLPSSPAKSASGSSAPNSASKSPASSTKSPLSYTKPSPATAAASKPSAQTNEADEESDEDEELAPVLTMDDQQSILDILNNAGAISNIQYAALLRLLKVGDRRLSALFQSYEQDKDVHGLIRKLGDISSMLVNMIKEEQEEDAANEERSSSSSRSDGSDGSSDDGDEDDDEEDEEDALDDEDRESIEGIFLNIVQNMKLNHLETAALRLAIARDDSSIRSCLEDFRRTRSEQELMEGLHAIARNTIEATLQEAGYDGLESEEQGGEESAGQEEKDWLNAQDEDRGDEDDESASEEDSDEEDEEPEESLMSTQAARERVFPLLISELSKESILTAEEARKLYKLFLEKNDVLSSALDVYDLDQNIAELVDTMLRLARV